MLIVLDVILKASVILAVASVIAAMLRRASASARHLVWTLGLVGALAAPALAYVLPRWELPVVRIAADPARAAIANAPAVSTRLENAGQPAAVTPPRHRGITPSTLDASGALASSAQPAPAAWTWRSLLFLVWAIGAAFVTVRVLIGLAAVQWMTRRTTAVNDASWLPLARSLAGSLGLERVRFLRTERSSMPMAWGILRGSVLMPADADAWPADRLRIVLLHELAHVKRRDCVTHLVAQLACAAYWFNPLAWMAARRLRTERERACDDLVLAAGTDGPDYADQLLEIARAMNGGRFPAIMAGASLAMAHRSQLEGRLIAILDPNVPRRRLSTGRAVAATVFFGALLVSVASVKPWAEENAASKDREAQLPAAGAARAADVAPVAAPAPAAHAQTRTSSHVSVHPSAQGLAEGIANGIASGVTDGIQGGITEGITRGVRGGVVGGVVGGIAGGVVDGIAGGIGEIVSEAVSQTTSEADRHRGPRGQADPRTVAALIEALKDTDKDVRETAMHALTQLRDPRVFDPLVASLKDASADVREQAAFGLGQLRDARAVEPLTAALKDSNADVREQVVFALGQLRAASAIEGLTTALRDADADVREQAAFALGQLRDRRAVDPLMSALKDEKPDVREQAAFALSQIRDAKSVEALVIALKDSNPSVREQAAFALGQLRDPRAIDGLTVALKDSNASVRQQAAFALGQIR